MEAITSPALETDRLSVRYGDVWALREVTLTIEQGSCFAVVGANGAGKTSLVSSIMGLVRPTAGTIRILGRDITHAPAEARAEIGVSVSLEGRRLFADLTVEENLRVATLVLSRPSRGGALEQAYGLFPKLAERRGQRAGTLSGGEQQMVALARAMITNPKVLVLDEPSLGLAPWVAEEALRQVWDLPARGTTVIIAEQNTSVLPDRCIPACLMYNGHLLLIDRLSRVMAVDDAETQALLQKAAGTSC